MNACFYVKVASTLLELLFLCEVVIFSLSSTTANGLNNAKYRHQNYVLAIALIATTKRADCGTAATKRRNGTLDAEQK